MIGLQNLIYFAETYRFVLLLPFPSPPLLSDSYLIQLSIYVVYVYMVYVYMVYIWCVYNVSGIFMHISRNQLQSADMTEYPFATAGINISYLLIQLLKLKKGIIPFILIFQIVIIIIILHTFKQTRK